AAAGRALGDAVLDLFLGLGDLLLHLRQSLEHVLVHSYSSCSGSSGPDRTSWAPISCAALTSGLSRPRAPASRCVQATTSGRTSQRTETARPRTSLMTRVRASRLAFSEALTAWNSWRKPRTMRSS